jgi:hypothetical protein
MDLQGIGWWEAASGMMGQDRDRLWAVVYVVMNLQVLLQKDCAHGVNFVFLFSFKKTL